MWRELWAAAAACPAAAQRALMDAELEGERALHYLETLAPLAVLDQVLAAGVAAATQLLAACRGAALPVAAHALTRCDQLMVSLLFGCRHVPPKNALLLYSCCFRLQAHAPQQCPARP